MSRFSLESLRHFEATRWGDVALGQLMLLGMPVEEIRHPDPNDFTRYPTPVSKGEPVGMQFETYTIDNPEPALLN